MKISPPPTIADGLRVQTPGALTFPITRANADDVLTVTDEEILATMRFMLFRMKLLVEPSGAAAAAAVSPERFPLIAVVSAWCFRVAMSIRRFWRRLLYGRLS